VVVSEESQENPPKFLSLTRTISFGLRPRINRTHTLDVFVKKHVDVILKGVARRWSAEGQKYFFLEVLKSCF
jgi:hypothetical protein